MLNGKTEHATERLRPREGEERVRQALEDGVIARQRDPNGNAGWSIADLARDLCIDPKRAARMVHVGGGVNLRAGQIPLLRPRIRAAVFAAIGGASATHLPIDKHVRRANVCVGRLNEMYDRALGGDGVIDADERAQLRAEFRQLASTAAQSADDLGGES
jgi:hypothetical protein